MGMLLQAAPTQKLVALKLTDDQKSKIADAAKQAQEKVKAAPKGDAVARKAVATNFKAKFESLLTGDQKKEIASKGKTKKKKKTTDPTS